MSSSIEEIEGMKPVEKVTASPTPGPWEAKDVAGAGLEIWASVNIGSDQSRQNLQPIYRLSVTPQLRVGKDGKAFVHIAYEDWRQFPSVDFDAMQKANARLIAAAPALLEQLEEALEFLAGYEDTIDGEDGQPAPNKAMILCRYIRATIANAKGNSAF